MIDILVTAIAMPTAVQCISSFATASWLELVEITGLNVHLRARTSWRMKKAAIGNESRFVLCLVAASAISMVEGVKQQ